MIIGLGSDLVDISRIAGVHQRFGARFARRFLAAEELALLPPQPTAWLAGRFAAKEAAAKALGTGFRDGVEWRDILALPNQLGKPELVLRGEAAALAARMGVRKCHVSISHERQMALAVAILEG